METAEHLLSMFKVNKKGIRTTSFKNTKAFIATSWEIYFHFFYNLNCHKHINVKCCSVKCCLMSPCKSVDCFLYDGNFDVYLVKGMVACFLDLLFYYQGSVERHGDGVTEQTSSRDYRSRI